MGPTIPEVILERYRPWFVSSLLVGRYLPNRGPLDTELMAFARSLGLRVVFLETIDVHIALRGNPVLVEGYVENLADLVAAPELAPATGAKFLQAYLDGDERSLMTCSDRSLNSQQRAGDEIILLERNQAWLPTIEAEILAGGAFIAVGLGHLIGERNLRELLSERGFDSRRITVEPPAVNDDYCFRAIEHAVACWNAYCDVETNEQACETASQLREYEPDHCGAEMVTAAQVILGQSCAELVGLNQ